MFIIAVTNVLYGDKISQARLTIIILVLRTTYFVILHLFMNFLKLLLCSAYYSLSANSQNSFGDIIFKINFYSI